MEQAEAVHDFDFWMGEWHVQNRLRRKWLADCDEWDEFEADVTAHKILDGLGNQDEFRTGYLGGYVGMSFRFFSPDTGKWSIYWASSRRPGVLDPPVTGGFDGDRGVFEGIDTHQGQPVHVRYIWSGVTTPTPRWQQDFSGDGGLTWETNWIMDFSRAAG